VEGDTSAMRSSPVASGVGHRGERTMGQPGDGAACASYAA
jgi:hypothetical protein